MKIITYLAFTLFSVMIQFCIIDYIQAKLEVGELKPKYLNLTSQKKFSDIIKEYGDKPHALYYRTESAKLKENILNTSSISVYTNTTQSEKLTTENIPTSSVYDIMYEENVTSASESSSTSELPFTTTEFENVTDLTIFTSIINNATDAKATPKPKKQSVQDNCYCDLLYRLCDINCCCDGDCMDNERNLFNCMEKGIHDPEQTHSCSAWGNKSPMLSGINNLFCVVKTNLPNRQNIIHKKYNAVDVSKVTKGAMKWHDKSKSRIPIALTPKLYAHGDPVWVLRNNTVTYIDLPLSKINGNCDSRVPIYFLKQEHVQCNVVIRELEMFNIQKAIEETKVISVKSMNTSNLNCSELHCTNWKIKVCNETTCTNYTTDLHEPSCTDNVGIICKNLAVKVEYVFYYWDSKIVDAVLYFYVQTILSKVQFIRQEISVKFYLAEGSAKKVVTLSGNPGYLKGLPLIASFEKDNHTRNFFNNGSKLGNTLNYPDNKNGICVFTNTTNFVTFGTNKRNKCLYIFEPKLLTTNATDICENIYNNIKIILGLGRGTVVAPLGNPYGLNDEDWIALIAGDKPQPLPTTGELYGASELMCYHMITKVSLNFGFADVSEIVGKAKLKILSASALITTQNITISEDHSSVILTFETNFADATKRPVYEYAGSPQLNIHLPRDFFFPFPSNKCYRVYERNVAILVICLVLTFTPK